MSFTWRDSSEWMTIIFDSEKYSKMPSIICLDKQFHNKQAFTIERAIARKVWNQLVAQDWTTE